MRFESFNTSDQQPLGVGEDKETFINPADPERVISVLKEKKGIEKESPNKLKGAYYLTKIAHLLLPENIPEIYQAGESKDGQQSFDRERVAHTPGHAQLQADRLAGNDQEDAAKLLMEEMGQKATDVTMKIESIGLGFNIDENIGNYSLDEQGDAQYLETFMPWENDVVDPSKLELLFDEAKIRESINSLADEESRREGGAYLERLLKLFEEEQTSVSMNFKMELGKTLEESGDAVKVFDAMVEHFEANHNISALFEIKTLAEALKSADRASAKEELVPIFKFLNDLIAQKKITQEQYNQLYMRYQKFSRAVGMVNSGKVDHER